LSPIPFAHETHRGRIFYTPWSTLRVLKQFEEIKVCSDYSHWVVVCERYNGILCGEEFEEVLALCKDRMEHIHARVGYGQGPQVPDPRDPFFANEVKGHFDLWNDLMLSFIAREKVITYDPEYGPVQYCPVIPFSEGKPIVDIEEIIDWTVSEFNQNYQIITSSIKDFILTKQ